MKYITYSFWGQDERFGIGAIQNAELAKKLFPDWTCIFYHDDTVDAKYPKILSNFSNTEVINVESISEGYKHVHGAFWRFFPLFEREGHFIVRDTDSRLTVREARAVNEWVQSDKIFHVIRDHESHYEWPVLAGLWGMKGIVHPYFHKQMQKYWLANFYTVDQVFLAREIWPNVQQHSLVHGIREGGWFSQTRNDVGHNFVGEGWYADNTPIYSADYPSKKYKPGSLKNEYNPAL